MNQDDMIKLVFRTALISVAATNTTTANVVPAAAVQSILVDGITLSTSSNSIANLWDIRNHCVSTLGMVPTFFPIDL